MKIGILGYGSIGERHGTNLLGLGLGHQVLWYDPNERDLCSREGIIDWADAVVVASPTKQHIPDFQDVIDLGKHVFVEKPFGYDAPAPYIDGYLKGARMRWGAKTIIATGFNLRFHDCVKKAKELLPDIGNIVAAHFAVFQKTEKPLYLQDGIIRNWCSHEIDLALYLLGPGILSDCHFTPGDDGRDTVEAWVSLDIPTVQTKCFIQADYYTNPEQRFFWIAGENGTIYVDLVKRNVFFRDREGNPRPILSATDSFDRNYIDEMKCFVQSIETGQHQAPLATGEDGAAVHRIIMEAREKAGLHD